MASSSSRLARWGHRVTAPSSLSSPAMESRPIRIGSPGTWLVVIVVVGLLVRIAAVANSGFPVGDGGMFAAMIGDIRDAGFALPSFTSYNGGDIPFAYPPLGLYLGAVLPLDPLVTLRWLPALLATAAMPLIYLIGRRMGGEAVGLAAAAFAALAPFGWFGLVEGGGLTRAPGLLLALGAILAALHGRSVLVGVLGGLAALTHLEAAIFAAVSVTAILVIQRRWPQLVVAGIVSIVVVAPWVVLVVARHGWEPFLAAAGARSVNPIAAVLSISGDRPGALDLAAAIGLIGLAASRVRWLYASAITTAVLVSTSVETHFMPLMALGVGMTVGTRRLPRAVVVATGVLLLVGAGVTIGNPEPLGSDDRALMEWVRRSTPPDARFAVLSDETWARADEAEWFPYLADRVSVVTMQGREWLPDWQVLEAERQALLACTDRACVDDWVSRHDVDYIYLADDCCARLEALIPGELVRQEGTATLFAR